MASPVYACGGECGAYYTGSGNSVFHIWSSAGSSLWTFSTTTVRNGLRSMRYLPVAGSATINGPSGTASTTRVWRDVIRFATLPDADCLISYGNYSGTYAGVGFKVSDSKLYSAVSIAGVITFGATGVAVTTGVFYVCDVKTVGSLVTGTADIQVGGAACAQATGAFAAANANGVDRGSGDVNITADIFFEDFLLSETSGDYPLGDGYVISYIPNADGSHNVAGANDFERTATGTDITNLTTDAYELVNDRPLPTTAVDWINGIAPPNSTDYVEIAYEDSAESAAPRSVEAIVVYHDASGAGTNNFSVTLRESGGGTTADIMAAATRNVGATISYARAHFATVPGTSDAYTLTKFNALRSRFLVSDSSPDPYIDALMLEAEYNAVVAAIVTTEYGMHAIERGATAGIETGARMGGWLEH